MAVGSCPYECVLYPGPQDEFQPPLPDDSIHHDFQTKEILALYGGKQWVGVLQEWRDELTNAMPTADLKRHAERFFAKNRVSA